MRRLLVQSLPAPGKPAHLAPEEARHALLVLRLHSGDQVEVLDGKGGRCRGRLVTAGAETRVEFEAALEGPRADDLPITLEISILKGAAMEWVVEKAVELGAQSLTPLLTQRTVVKVGSKGPESFQQRWQKIADQALKQCGRPLRMEVASPLALERRLQQLQGKDHALLFCDDEGRGEALPLLDWLSQQPLKPVHLFVGPEGGWSPQERDLLLREAQPVSLGPLVLRAETAALLSLGLTAASLRAKKA